MPRSIQAFPEQRAASAQAQAEKNRALLAPRSNIIRVWRTRGCFGSFAWGILSGWDAVPKTCRRPRSILQRPPLREPGGCRGSRKAERRWALSDMPDITLTAPRAGRRLKPLRNWPERKLRVRHAKEAARSFESDSPPAVSAPVPSPRLCRPLHLLL